MTTFDPAINFGIGTVLLPYTSADTSIDLVTGDGLRFPDPGVMGAYNVTWWNASAYANPSDDPSREIVRVTAKTVDTLTITRAQEGTSASNKNAALATYKLSLGFTKKTYDDITTAINAITPSVWVPMETITFTASSAIQTTADFQNASTAKQYKILFDILTDVGGNTDIGFRVNGNSAAASYLTYLENVVGADTGTFSSTYARVSTLTSINCRLTGEIIIAAQEGSSDTVPWTNNCMQNTGTVSTGARGIAGIGGVDNYIKNLSFLSDQNITGTFSIFQRQ